MQTINSFILLCVFCLFCQPTLAQRRVRLADLPPFERAVVVVKYFEGLHGWKNYPYVGYGHQLQLGERFTADMTERQADSLLRADLWKCFEHFKRYGKDALLLTLLAYNVIFASAPLREASLPRIDYKRIVFNWKKIGKLYSTGIS